MTGGRVMTALAAGAVLALPAAPAVADDVPVSVSPDGLSWGTGFTDPLFDPAIRWVPGARRTAAFFVRNAGPGPAELQLQVRSMAHGPVENRDLRLAARTDGGWVPLGTGPGQTLTVDPLPHGGVSRVAVRVEHDPASTNESQRRTDALVLVVRLSEAAAGPATVEEHDGLLPDTGAPGLLMLLCAAGALLGAGVVVLRRGVRHG